MKTSTLLNNKLELITTPCLYLLIILSANLSSCSKQIKDIPSALIDHATNKKMPAVENGMLSFSSQKEFDHFKEVDLLESEPRFKGKFISMQSAFNQLVADDAALGLELALKYPNGDASIFDNTHSPLATKYSHAFYVQGTKSEGMFYAINCYDPTISKVINEKGLVKIGNDVHHYSKNFYKVWVKADMNHLEKLIEVKKSEDGIVVFDPKNGSIVKGQGPATLAILPTGYWVPDTWWSRDCQNTKRINGNKRVLGYATFVREKASNNFPRIPGYEFRTSFVTRSVSLKGRLFGSWYDANNDYPHIQNGYYSGNITNGFAQTVVGSELDTDNYTPVVINWSDGYNIATSRTFEYKLWHPSLNNISPSFQVPFFSDRYVSETAPTITSFLGNYSLGAGFATPTDNPYCSCGF